jgi:PilZ domain-containing protein
MKTVYANKTNQTTVIFPKCGFAKIFEATKFKNMHRRLKAKCRCGEVFEFTLEFRKYYRKKARLLGEYIIQRKGEKGDIIVEDLSMGGIRFENLGPHQISIDDMLEVKFKLDNPSRSEIHKMGRVIWIRDRTVGVMYSEPKGNDKDLGFYMRT